MKISSRITEADRRIASAEAAQVPSGPPAVHITKDLGPDEGTGKLATSG